MANINGYSYFLFYNYMYLKEAHNHDLPGMLS